MAAKSAGNVGRTVLRAGPSDSDMALMNLPKKNHAQPTAAATNSNTRPATSPNERAARRVTRRLRALVFPSLMVIDEIGYLPITRTGAMLFFQLLSRRYEHAATILTSNKGFEDWGEIFGDDVMAAAPVDRLVHHCHIVNIRGNSYRLRQHRDLARLLQQDGATRRQTPAREDATSPQG